jgi:hypothetical protein
MSIDEYADFERKCGAKVYKVNGFFWKEVRPFFYRPLFPFVKIIPGEAKPPLRYFWGGFQHPVPSYDLANSYMNLLVFDEICDYSIKKLTRNYRKSLKKGLKNFVVKPISNFSEFVTEGHRIYFSFYKRTYYPWRKERIDKKKFSDWAQILFNFPKISIMGAYRNNELCAISISCLVEDIVIYETFFSSTESLKLKTSDLMLHVIREMASEREDIKCIYMNLLKNKKGLDDFKINRGCKITMEQAYFWINPLLHFLIRQFKKEEYKKLIGINQEKIDEMLRKKPTMVDNKTNLS